MARAWTGRETKKSRLDTIKILTQVTRGGKTFVKSVRIKPENLESYTSVGLTEGRTPILVHVVPVQERDFEREEYVERREEEKQKVIRLRIHMRIKYEPQDKPLWRWFHMEGWVEKKILSENYDQEWQNMTDTALEVLKQSRATQYWANKGRGAEGVIFGESAGVDEATDLYGEDFPSEYSFDDMSYDFWNKDNSRRFSRHYSNGRSSPD
jgi:hypothetical protein